MTKRTRYFMAGSAAIMAAGLCAGLIAYYGGGLAALNASTGPSELAYVPADAAVVAYADVQSIMTSDLREQLRQRMPSQGDGQQEFQDKTGIDIERDIDYVVAAMTPGADHPTGLVVARGRFDIVRLEALVREHGGAVEDYQGKRLISTSPDKGEQFTLGFLEPGLVAVGTTAAVKHAIDANMTARSITSNVEIMDLVKAIAASNNAWAVGRMDVLASQAKLPDEIASRVPAVKWFAASGHINGGLAGTLRLEARDEQAAQQLRDIVRGFIALVQLQSQNDTRFNAIAQSVQLTGDGTTVALSFTLPVELLQLLPTRQMN